jgi:hypothetical protein
VVGAVDLVVAGGLVEAGVVGVCCVVGVVFREGHGFVIHAGVNHV